MGCRLTPAGKSFLFIFANAAQEKRKIDNGFSKSATHTVQG
jgi:hypothetical protein